MTDALWITLIGMGLVFLAILLLWGLMALLVRLTAEKPAAAVPEQPRENPVITVAVEQDQHELRRRAAAAGVAAALAMKGTPAPSKPPAPAISVNSWQSVQRASQLARLQGRSRKVQQ